MADFDLLDFRQQITQNNIILSFEGTMSQGVLTTLVDTIKEKLTSDHDSNGSMQHLVRKTYAIFVELAQNIQNHSAEKMTNEQQGTGIGIIVIRDNPTCYTILSGNCINKDKMDQLKTYCDYLNDLNEQDLKKVYKEKLRSERNNDTPGAGIGLIDILRKSGSPLTYHMQPLNEQNVFITLSVSLSKVK